jgi:hypothetical protein
VEENYYYLENGKMLRPRQNKSNTMDMVACCRIATAGAMEEDGCRSMILFSIVDCVKRATDGGLFALPLE